MNFERTAYLNRHWELFSAAPATMPPNLASLSRIHELGGYDSLINGKTVEMLTVVNGENPAPAANGNMMFVKNEIDDELRDAGVSFVASGSGVNPISGAPGRVSLSRGTASILDEDFSSVTIKAEGSGKLTLRDRMMMGWTATVDGKMVTLPDGTWREITIDSPGTHKVLFSYCPPGYAIGAIVSLISFIVLAVWSVINRRSP